MTKGPIGIFDSGFGGLSVFREIKDLLPQYDYIYLGDNARVPYGSRSFETVYEYTKECVFKLFDLNCHLVLLACNTASAKALKTIQQHDLPKNKKVLGVIRPTTEIINQYTQTNKIGILATSGTVLSESYVIEINSMHPQIEVHQQACPFWVPLVENNEIDTAGAHYFVKKDIDSLLSLDKDMDAIILGCTHYPLLMPIIERYVPPHIQVVSQGELVAKSLHSYLLRHPEIERLCLQNNSVQFYTTDSVNDFNEKGKIFFKDTINAKHIHV